MDGLCQTAAQYRKGRVLLPGQFLYPDSHGLHRQPQQRTCRDTPAQ